MCGATENRAAQLSSTLTLLRCWRREFRTGRSGTNGGHGGPPHWMRNAEQSLESRASLALYRDPHLRSSPSQGEGKKDPGFFAAAALE
jgi:hypothetical protein